MMWIPPRSPKMKRRILGFQRLVWWPKCTPASKSSLIPTLLAISSPWFFTATRGVERTRFETGQGRFGLSARFVVELSAREDSRLSAVRARPSRQWTADSRQRGIEKGGPRAALLILF